ncbi:MAG: nitrilase-related carbon-nitrogen hydrolase [Planctomycetaceae bacterium]
MSRILTIAVAQLGPTARSDARPVVVDRLIGQLRQAKQHGAELVVFPECALTPFFPHWWIEDQAVIDAYFESSPRPRRESKKGSSKSVAA